MRKFAYIEKAPLADEAYRFLSKFDENQFVSFVSGILNSLCPPLKGRKAGTIVIDATAITLDLNWFRRTITRAQLKTRDFDCGYSLTHGHYIGLGVTHIPAKKN